jgi:hypothetical protein
MARSRLYSLVAIACLAGYVWLIYLHTYVGTSKQPTICMIKSITSVPCPSCGTSRSVIMIMEGNYFDALKMNPLGFIISCILLVCPVWIFADVMMRRNSFLLFYQTIESFIRIKWVTILMIGLVAINWIWNIMKGI